MYKIRYILEKYKLKKEWRKDNKHNFTEAENLFDINKVIVGNYTYGPLFVRNYGNSSEKLEIGNFCSIARGVTFLLGGKHDYNCISTYPFKKKFLDIENESITKGPIIIKDDVWIGENAMILSGVTINQGAIIGAGSIVSKEVPAYAIFAGNKIIKYRFSEDIIKELLKIDYSLINEEIINKNIELFSKKINSIEDVKDILNAIKGDNCES